MPRPLQSAIRRSKTKRKKKPGRYGRDDSFLLGSLMVREVESKPAPLSPEGATPVTDIVDSRLSKFNTGFDTESTEVVPQKSRRRQLKRPEAKRCATGGGGRGRG